jgi:histidine ammonia-lyase
MHSADLKTSTSARTIKLDDGPLRIEDIIDIAEGSARVVLSDSHEFCAGIARGADFLDRLLREEGTIYGVTTGYGDSYTVTVPLELVAELPRHLLHLSRLWAGGVFVQPVGCGCRKRRTIV